MIHEFHQCYVELEECAHDLVVYVEGQPLVKLIRSDPSNRCAHYFHLVVYALDRIKALAEALSDCAVEHELLDQSRTLVSLLLSDLQCVMLG